MSSPSAKLVYALIVPQVREGEGKLADQLVDAVADRNLTEWRRRYLQLLGEVHGCNTFTCDSTDFSRGIIQFTRRDLMVML